MDAQRKRHRLWTIGLMAAILLSVFLLCFVAPLFTSELNRNEVLRFPFGFYLAAQGSFLVLTALIFWIAGRQEDVDRRLGAAEDS